MIEEFLAMIEYGITTSIATSILPDSSAEGTSSALSPSSAVVCSLHLRKKGMI